ncbi:MAG: hypothetical protein IPG89_07940 [Bacteroidetes bacterium]|jgi:hypothetical protein|nr:hypothetical protein [Bacteroidota bacterium]
MKKKLFLAFVFASLGISLFVACKKESNDGISVGYKEEKGTGANPNVSSTTGSTTAATTT